MIDYSALTFRVEPMQLHDIADVMDIEIVSFSAPWSARAYEYELQYNEMAHYSVVRARDNGSAVSSTSSIWRRILGRGKAIGQVEPDTTSVVGYGGFWLMVDEAHVSTLATHPRWRRRGVGELLLLTMIDQARAIGARWVTLEVRVSNAGAQSLYRKYGFEVTGERKNYYSDNGEDALIMTTPVVTTMEYQLRIQQLKQQLVTRLSQ